MKFIFFNVSYYEADEYVLFNPEKQIIKSIWSYPTFIDEKVIYSVSDFNALNGSSSFEFQSLLKDEFFALYVDSWKIISFSQVKNKFYFEFSSEWKNESNKYIRLTLKII